MKPLASVRYVDIKTGHLTLEGMQLFGAISLGSGTSTPVTIADGDKGDVIVSGAGSVWVLDYEAVNGVIAPAWANITETPTTLAGYGITDALADTYETVASNLDASDAVYAYVGGALDTITYANGVVKTFAYSGGDLVSVTLSGATPSGIALTKTLTYAGGDLVGAVYS